MRSFGRPCRAARTPPHFSTVDATPPDIHSVLHDAVTDLFAALAPLLLAHGVHHGSVEQALRVAMVRAARDAALQAQPTALPHRLVSKLSAATGINRREVTRLLQLAGHEERQKPSPSLRVLARWLTDPALLASDGTPVPLPRQGDAHSFETLASSVTRDVHPRSLLDDLVRLQAVHWDPGADQVRVLKQSFVPDGDQARMMGYLRDNVADHLKAAVDNVLGLGPAHLEQAVIANGLSPESVQAIRELVRAQWAQLRSAMVPAIQALINADEAAGRPTTERVRIGMYAYTAGESAPTTESKDSPP